MLLYKPPDMKDQYFERLQECAEVDCRYLVTNTLAHGPEDTSVIYLETAFVLLEVGNCDNPAEDLKRYFTVDRVKQPCPSQ